MEFLREPRKKLLAALAAVAALVAMAPAAGAPAARVAQIGLLVTSIAVIGWAYRRFKAANPGERSPVRLRVIGRAGLSQRTGLALVEVDGRAFLVVHGDGFAEIRDPEEAGAPSRAVPRARRVPSTWRKAGVA